MLIHPPLPIRAPTVSERGPGSKDSALLVCKRANLKEKSDPDIPACGVRHLIIPIDSDILVQMGQSTTRCMVLYKV